MNVKSLAYDALIEYGIDSLPIRLGDKELNNIYIFSWQQYFSKCEKPVRSKIYKQDGAVMCLKATLDARYVLFYNDSLPEETKRWVIAKLLYYARSGFAQEHACKYIMPDEEVKATEFASHFLCPDVILSKYEILNAEDIIHYCRVPFSVARRKARYLKNGYKRFQLPSLEKMKTCRTLEIVSRMRQVCFLNHYLFLHPQSADMSNSGLNA
ncbi:MAG: hypothetical protein IJE23_05600 [Tyzzerella sp.]|nr:hypothetical protein [Tyzzerella sp.]